jgi:hypothetical protein
MKTNYTLGNVILILLLTFALNAQSQGWEKIVNKPKATFSDVKKEAEKYFDQHGRGKGSGYKQYQRWCLYNSARLMPGGKMADVNAMNEKALQESSKKSAARISSVSGAWTSLGPTKLLNGAYQPGQGRVNRLVVDPSNTNIIYAGTPKGGLWKTINGGTSWTLSSKGTESVSGIVIDPNSSPTSRTIYLLTGDADGFGSYEVGSNGVTKSTDGGLTWGALTMPWTFTPDKVLGYKMINDPANGQVLFVVSSKGIHKSTNGAVSWSTKKSGYFYDIVYKPGSSTTLYASANEGVFKSINSGETWTLMTSTLPVSPNERIALGVTPANSNYLYVYYGDPGYGRGLYRSIDGGTSFQSRTTDSKIMQSQPNYDHAIAVSPTNAEEVYLGAVEGFKSLNGGLNFDLLATTELDPSGPLSPRYVHADYHSLLFVGSTLYAATDAGVFKTTNGGDTWTTICDGLDILEVFHLNHNPTDPSVILAGTQDNGTSSIINKNNTQQFGGDGFYCFFDPTNKNRFYGSWNDGNLLRCEQNWAQPKDRSKEDSITPQAGWIENHNVWRIMNVPFVMDPTNPKVLFGAYHNLYRSPDRGLTWANITPTGLAIEVPFNKMKVCETNSNHIYASKYAEMWYTPDGGVNWNYTKPEPWLGIEDIEIHPTNPLMVWKVVSGYESGQKVFVSTDGGANWVNMDPANSLPNVPVLSIVYHKGSNEGIYIGTDLGVYYKDNTLTNWIPYSTGLPLISVRDLEIDYKNKRLIAGTFGRGIWTSDLYAAGNNAPVVSITYPTASSTIAANPKINVEVSVTVTNPIVKVELYHGEAKIGEDNSSPYNITWNNAPVGAYTLIAKATDNKGIVSYSSYIPVTISNSVALPLPWVQGDIGTVVLAGTGTYSSGTFTVKGSGADIWGTADAFHYVYQPVNGNVEIIAKVNSITNTNAWAKGGVMIRETLAANSKNVSMIVSPTSGMNLQSRSTIGGSTVSTGTTGAAPIWVKLNRTGNIFTTYKSADGLTWTQVGSPLTISMTASVYVGLALTSHNTSAVTTSAFSSVSVTTGTNAAPVVSLTAPSNNAGYASPATIVLNATATDANGIQKVEFYNGASLLFIDNASPFTYTWTGVGVGTYTLKAVAFDNTGLTATSSLITVKVSVAPVVSITLPANNATYSAPAAVNIRANATDSDGISKVEFYNGTTLLGFDNTTPYEFVWSNVNSGTYSLKAIAYDNVNVTATSSIINISVTGGACSAPQWAAATPTYTTGTVVKNTVGGTVKKYQCTVAGWCQSASAFYYEPGVGQAWTDCWTDLGVCASRMGSAGPQENLSTNLLEVFPNPTSGSAKINGFFNGDGIIKVSIHNVLGNEVIIKDVKSNDGNFECELEVGSFPKGVYTIKAVLGEEVILKKLVVN